MLAKTTPNQIKPREFRLKHEWRKSDVVFNSLH